MEKKPQHARRAPGRELVTRIVVTGSECTGKTTLAAALASHYRTSWSEEYVRLWVEAAARGVEAGDVAAIARGQVAVEEEAIRKANGIVLHDTDLLSTIVYSRHYFGSTPSEVDELLAARRPSLYLLCDIDVPWSADGLQRDRGDRRDEMQRLFRGTLIERGARFVEIRGLLEKRLGDAIRAIEEATSSSRESVD